MQVRFPSWAGFFFFFFNDDGGASTSGASERKARALKRVQSTKPAGAKRPSRRAGMSAANVGASGLMGDSFQAIA